MTESETTAMRRFPTLGDYSTALQHPRLCFPGDPDLRSAEVTEDILLGPMASSGNFGGVYHLHSPDGQREWGVKCFTRASDIRPERYRSICAHLASVDPDVERWYVPIEFVPEGIRVGDDHWPIAKMSWIRAPGLLEWIDRNVANRTYLRKLAGDFTDVVLRLEELDIAHGDLQHGNILVSAGRRVRLVDYDAMYVPGLAGAARPEGGHRHYQHPRAGTLFGPRMDRFPARVIQLSLLAVAASPELWTDLRDEEDERLLLGTEDFADPAASRAFDTLSRSADPEVRDLTTQVLRDLAADPRALPPLERVRPVVRRIPAQTPRTAPVFGEPPPAERAAPDSTPGADGTCEASGAHGAAGAPGATRTPGPASAPGTPSGPTGTRPPAPDPARPHTPGPTPAPGPVREAAPASPCGRAAAEPPPYPRRSDPSPHTSRAAQRREAQRSGRTAAGRSAGPVPEPRRTGRRTWPWVLVVLLVLLAGVLIALHIAARDDAVPGGFCDRLPFVCAGLPSPSPAP
ncbi:hypothetical protein KUM39_14450 [Streptomyces sp. J2-1]|uniref:hypothetical protein n=1 Tax=Streptomyces corallincola TaxID=2851888 RepID=UPI001C393DEB|nr:hypothetical protein [Streptomyces corallincola]MBV2355555.1 hypothetical protein [Streptomyces corallincola]